MASDLSREVTFEWVCSHIDASLSKRIGKAFLAYLHVLYIATRYSSLIFHIHVSAHGSFFRKSLFIWIARAFGHPTILHMHSSSFEAFIDGSPSWVRSYVSAVMNQSTSIIALSKGWKDYYGMMTSTPITVIPNFIKDSGTSPNFDNDGQQMLFLGRYGVRKGIYDVINALPPLIRTHPRFHLTCAGDGDLETIRQLILERDLQSHVTFYGWVDGPDKEALLRGASILLLPSHAEGLPMAILEAMEAGLCIVTTPVGGIPEMIEDGVNGRIVPVGQPKILSAVLINLLGDVKQQRRLGKRARENFVEHFSEKVVIPRFSALYRTLKLGYSSAQ